MAAHASTTPATHDIIKLDARAGGIYRAMKIAAVVGLVAGVGLAFLDKEPLRRFYFAYLTSLGYVLSIALGALGFVLIQYVTRAGWSVGVRRIAENMAATLPVIAVASLPILVSVVMQEGDLYPWALPKQAATPDAIRARQTGDVPEEVEAETRTQSDAAGVVTKERVGKSRHRVVQPIAEEPQEKRLHLDPITYMKRTWLNPFFFLFRVLVAFGLWSAIALFYLKQSTLQDQTHDVAITSRLQAWSAPCLVVLGLTTTIGAFDLFMSLDPHWYSTMFGVYYIAGCLVSSFATMIIITYILQRKGYLRGTITVEHYHDLGKFMFAFTFFWGYIAFSQFMLLWYANLPETVVWLSRRGATTSKVIAGVPGDPASGSTWSIVAIVLLFGKLLVPFAGVMSRHIKRRPGLLTFWAVWILVFHFVDMYWIVMPQFSRFNPRLVDLALMIAMVAMFIAAILHNAIPRALRPTADPRLPDSLAFQNI